MIRGQLAQKAIKAIPAHKAPAGLLGRQAPRARPARPGYKARKVSRSSAGIGVRGKSTLGFAIYGETSGANSTFAAVYGKSFGSALAGKFDGNVSVTGNLSKGGGSFKIDHPLDPANKYLYHSFVESPDMKNIYDGVVRLDDNDEAEISLPAYFEALNRDFRYQLTAIGAPAPGLYIAQEVSGNRFRIAGGLPGLKVSWTVTGIRQDAYANAKRIPIEEDKPEEERGFYLHPLEHGQVEEKGVDWARQSELMRERKQRRAQLLPPPVNRQR